MSVRRHSRLRVSKGTRGDGFWRRAFAAAYRRVSPGRIAVAVGITLFIHLAVYLTAPETLAIFVDLSSSPQVELLKPEAVEIPEDLLPEEFRKKNELRFVPTNADAPVKLPNETNNHSAADQRAAQPVPDPTSHSRTPTNDGELEDSRGISDRVMPRELLPPEMQNFPQHAQRGKSGEKKSDGESSDKQSGVPARESEAGAVSLGEGTESRLENPEEDEDVPEPLERPRIVPPPGLKTLTMRSNTATNEVGAVAIDAKFSEFGDYTQRMLESIQAAWYITVEKSSITQHSGMARVRFTLCSDGTVKDAVIEYSSVTDAAAYACLDAVESRAPFEVWRADMVALFGAEQTSTISFYYR